MMVFMLTMTTKMTMTMMTMINLAGLLRCMLSHQNDNFVPPPNKFKFVSR